MACADYQDKALQNLPCKRVQIDEIWSFVGAKEKNATAAQRIVVMAISGLGPRSMRKLSWWPLGWLATVAVRRPSYLCAI
jgi:hypothetical protein